MFILNNVIKYVHQYVIFNYYINYPVIPTVYLISKTQDPNYGYERYSGIIDKSIIYKYTNK